MILAIACLNGCGSARALRGCCIKCFRRFQKAVKEGKTTWEKLIKAKKVLPARQSKTRRRWNKCDWNDA